jgi:FkbM family methyltransferase
MLINSLLRSLRPRGPVHVDAEAGSARRVEDLPGFNKLVRGRHGVFLANANDVYICRALIAYGEFCEIEGRFLHGYCRPGDVVAEVGANIGAHTVTLAKAVGDRGRVLAIEPQPVVFQAMCANLALNCVLNADAANCGCAATAKALSIPLLDYAQEGNFGGLALRAADGAPSLPVRCEPLDRLLLPYSRVDLIKIDVEGMEEDVLAGARDAIREWRPVLYVENDRPQKSSALIAAIHALGYRAWWHIPPLFNPDNYFGNAADLYPHICSFNMVCLPTDGAREPPTGLREALPSEPHPLSSVV